MPPSRAVRLLLPIAIVVASGCTAPVEPAEPPALDRCSFERDVYPLLARDCGFNACHGAPDRFFRVHAPGRARLDPATAPLAPPTAAEVELTFERARSMLSGAPRPEESLLLRKPLEPAAGGGGGHLGVDGHGRSVYANVEDGGWPVIATWARGESTPCP